MTRIIKPLSLSIFNAMIIMSFVSCDKSDENNMESAFEPVMEIFTPDKIGGGSVTLVATVPFDCLKSTVFEISTDADMQNQIDYTTDKILNIPNSAKKSAEIQLTVSGLNPNTEYFVRTVGTTSENVKIFSPVLSFRTMSLQKQCLKMPRAMIMGKNGNPKCVISYGASVDITKGTISGQLEKYGVDAQIDSNDLNGQYETHPSIKVWDSGVEGTFCAFAFINDNVSSNFLNGTGLNRFQYTTQRYFGEYDDSNCGTDYAVGKGSINDEEFWLQSTTACLELTVTNEVHNCNFIWIRDLKKSSILFRAGSLDLRTGKWIRDEERIKEIVNSNPYFGYDMCVIYESKKFNIQVYRIYIPPVEFEDGDLGFALFKSGAGADLPITPIPGNKWEAGKTYSYRLTFKK